MACIVPAHRRRLAVLGISYSSDEATVRTYFEGFGAVDVCELMLDRTTGRSRGFAFVTMNSAEVSIHATLPVMCISVTVTKTWFPWLHCVCR